MAASLLVERSFDRAEPIVADDPDELAVPALLVPGGGGEAVFAELPAPLGSLPELLKRRHWLDRMAPRLCLLFRPRRAGIWRARSAAGASRRPARGTARAAPRHCHFERTR